MKTLTTFAILAFATSTIHAQRPTTITSDSSERWVRLSTTTDGDVWYGDKRTIERKGQKITLWTKTVYATPQKDSKGTYTYDLTQVYLDCETRMWAFGSYANYSRDDTVVSSGNNAKNGIEWEAAPPESIIEGILTPLCKAIKQP